MIDTKTAENTYNSIQHAILFLRLEPTLSTTPPDMVMWGPWDSCMKRSALWTSKIRCLHLSLSLSLSLTHTQQSQPQGEDRFDFSKAFPIRHLFSRNPFLLSSHTLFPLVICRFYGYSLAWGLLLYEIIVDYLLTASLASEVHSVKWICWVKCCWVCREGHTESHLACPQLHYGCKTSSWNVRLSLNCFQEEVQRKADLGRVLAVLSTQRSLPWIGHVLFMQPFKLL